MAQIIPVPRHLSATIGVDEAFDLIATLRSALRDLEGVPDSVAVFADSLEGAYIAVTDGGELPNVDTSAQDEDGGTTVPV